jgi:multidrug efflux pump subunit AcrA (membrane-fusion protein)
MGKGLAGGATMKRFNRVLVFLGSLLLLVGVGVAIRVLMVQLHAEQNLHIVQRTDFILKESASGTLKSADSVYIKPLHSPGVWNYKLTFMVEEGVHVQEGDVLLRFDEQRLREQLSRAESELATQKKLLEKSQLEHGQKLGDLTLKQVELDVDIAKQERVLAVPEEHMARAELDKERLEYQLKLGQKRLNDINLRGVDLNQKSNLRKMQTTITQYETEIADLKRAIERMTVRAPKAGLVVYIPNWRNEKPKIGDSIWHSQTILELPNLEQMQVLVTIPERGAGKVAVGQLAEVRLDAVPDRIFRGTVENIGAVFRRKSPTKPSIVFDAIVNLNELDAEVMRPGMAASVEIMVERIPEVIQIPLEALHSDEEGDYVLLGGLNQTRRNVTPGIRNDAWITIEKGLEEDESIVVPAESSGDAS